MTHSTHSAAIRDGDVYRRKRAIFAYLVCRMYILKEKGDFGCRTVTAPWGSATQDTRKMDALRRNVAEGVCVCSVLSNLNYPRPVTPAPLV